MSRLATIPFHSPRSLEQIVDSLPGMIAYWDRSLVCRYANHAYLDWFAQDPIGMIMPDLLGPRLFGENRTCVAGVLEGERQSFVRSVQKHDGSVAQTQATYVPDVDANGTIVGFYVSVTDVTAFKNVEQRLREREAALSETLSARCEAVARLELAEQVANVGHWRIDYPGPVLSWSDEVFRIHGVTPDAYVPQIETALAFYHPEDRSRIQTQLERAASRGVPYDVRARLVRPTGEIRHVRTRGVVTPGPDGRPAMIFGALLDVTDQQRIEDALRAANDRLDAMAHTDGLLGIPNRRRFDEAFDVEWRSAARCGEPLSVALLDVDKFKAFNDRYGHREGDDCLRAIAGAVRSALKRPKDLVARYGGEELVILLPSTDRIGALAVAERARASVEALGIPHAEGVSGRSVVTVSVGVEGVFPANDAVPQAREDLLAEVDAMLYRAKGAGRNAVVSRS